MKKWQKRIITISILAIIAFIIFDFFNVSGREIEGVLDISESSEVTIKKSYHMVDGETEYVLGTEEIYKLKELILKSNFWRGQPVVVFFEDKDLYEIYINNNNGEEWLIINCIGNEYISGVNEFSGKHLKIKNPKWKETLEEIITMSENK